MSRGGPYIPAMDESPVWSPLRKRMRHAAWACVAIVALPALFVFFLEHLWEPRFEWPLAFTMTLLFLYIMSAQYRLGNWPCPRCGRPWFGRPWYHPAPFLLCRHRCAACGLKAGEDPSTPEED